MISHRLPALLSRVLVTSALLGASSTALLGQVKIPPILGSGMVLQRDLSVPIWGTAKPGETVTVAFAGQTVTAKADDQGAWRVDLGALEASAEGRTLTISGSTEIRLENVLVGEVWLCSGQSNMEWSVRASANRDAEIQNANFPRIRLFDVPGRTVAPAPQLVGRGSWRVCSPKTVPGFSAVGYYFGRRLRHELGVPIGLVGVNWGGTRIEPWTPIEGFQAVDSLAKEAAQSAKQAAEGSKVNGRSPSAIYNSMVHPLVPFAARGVIWYQGESNGNEGPTYLAKMKALIHGWRQKFQPDLAFYWVQLANFQQTAQTPAGGGRWSQLREAQRHALEIPHTGMAVTTDIGEGDDIHPRNKQDVGWRLAQAALHGTYGRKGIVPGGPLYKSHRVEGAAIRVSFTQVGRGLMVGRKRGMDSVRKARGKLRHFAIAGADRKWHWAEATIDGADVLVASKLVPEPVAVRYGFAMNPDTANLYNQDGFPASPFRTDDWPVDLKGGR